MKKSAEASTLTNMSTRRVSAFAADSITGDDKENLTPEITVKEEAMSTEDSQDTSPPVEGQNAPEKPLKSKVLF